MFRVLLTSSSRSLTQMQSYLAFNSSLGFSNAFLAPLMHRAAFRPSSRRNHVLRSFSSDLIMHLENILKKPKSAIIMDVNKSIKPPRLSSMPKLPRIITPPPLFLLPRVLHELTGQNRTCHNSIPGEQAKRIFLTTPGAVKTVPGFVKISLKFFANFLSSKSTLPQYHNSKTVVSQTRKLPRKLLRTPVLLPRLLLYHYC